ncbi:MAG: hypothetical protein IKA32_09585 [Lentisphaeria bacterium]|nr:hypothetical protein [Lentisphaeria bacterium]
MLRKCTAAVLVCLGYSVFAGLVDHGDYTGFPNVNVDAHLTKIARKYYPELSGNIPGGLARKAAWTQDIQKAASGLGIDKKALDALIANVLDPVTSPVAAAPHPKLLEFELYAAGRRELFRKDHTKLPPSWQKLMELPLEARKYTTIPVQYAFYRHRAFRGGSFDLYDKTYAAILESLKQGCADTQGCQLTLIRRSGRNPVAFRDDVRLLSYKRLFRKQFANYQPVKGWRYTNVMDIWRPARFRGDRFYSGDAAPDILFALNNEPLKNLYFLCNNDKGLRDLIVAVGLTNRQTKFLPVLAGEYALESEINYPVYALRISLESARKLLAPCPEHRQLLDLLEIKKLSGKALIAAIDKYIAKYPDYTPRDMPGTSVALNTHEELHALAGAELFKLGRPLEAAERWIKGGTPEDMGMVAEQVMSLEQLIAFCNKHYSVPVEDELLINSIDCGRNSKLLYPTFASKDEQNFFMRNLLARRLMRAGRFAEAEKYFTGRRTKIYAARYFHLQKIINSKTVPQSEKFIAVLNTAALLRKHGDKLFGTFLEPDNLICQNEYPCTWGTKQKFVKLNKPALPRYSYRYRAAELYGKAAELTNDRKLKGYCLWTAGNLIKNLNAKAADVYYKKLRRISSDLIAENWFVKKQNAPVEVQEFSLRNYFVAGDITAHQPPQPEIKAVPLAIDSGDGKKLLQAGKQLAEEILSESDFKKLPQSQYALLLAGNKGFAEADVWNAILQYTVFNNYEGALWFLHRAVKNDPDSYLIKHELGHVYLTLGYWSIGVKLIREAADNEKNNPLLLHTAARNMANLYSLGEVGVPKDPVAAAKYAKIAGEAEKAVRKQK